MTEPAAVTSSPRSVTRPSRTRISPKIAFARVDLPAPLGPITTTISPSAAVSVQPRRMSTSST